MSNINNNDDKMYVILRKLTMLLRPNLSSFPKFFITLVFAGSVS